MHCCDLSMIAIIKEGLSTLVADTDELGCLLASFRYYWSADSAVGSGARYIDRAVALLTSKDSPLEVRQELSESPYGNNTVWVGYDSINESVQSLGDYGSDEMQELQPTVYAVLDAKRIDEEEGKSVLVFPQNCGVEDNVWRLQRAYNRAFPTESFLVSDVALTDTEVWVKLDSLLSDTSKMRGWEFRAYRTGYQITYGHSGDSVRLNVHLRTTGDLEVHKILATVMRYVLKKSRTRSNEYQNLQVSSFSQSATVPDHEASDMAWITTFSITGIAHDVWIVNKRRLPEKIVWSIVAQPVDDTTNQDVTQSF